MLLDRLGRIPGLEVRTVEAGQADGETDGTRLFNALGSALADVPPDGENVRARGASSLPRHRRLLDCGPKGLA